jgi:hypothetical protein
VGFSDVLYMQTAMMVDEAPAAGQSGLLYRHLAMSGRVAWAGRMQTKSRIESACVLSKMEIVCVVETVFGRKGSWLTSLHEERRIVVKYQQASLCLSQARSDPAAQVRVAEKVGG